VQAVCLVWPFLVAYAREYRAMHHASDIVIGALFGIWCAWIITHAIPGAWPWGRTKVDEEVLDREAGLA
jgi:membrane-associated phospholipid phosphatase